MGRVLALFLLVSTTSLVVLRATILSIALLFAAGPSASFYCRAWCNPAAAAASGCHDDGAGASTQVGRATSCHDMALAVAAVLKEDVDRAASRERAVAAVTVASFQLVMAPPNVRPVAGRGRSTSERQPPLSTPLRN